MPIIMASSSASYARDTSTSTLVNPFHCMKISSHEPLRSQEHRSVCPHCKKSRKYYCYSCCKVIGVNPLDIPHVRLPIRVHIVKHRLELNGKSTAVQAKILAPDDICIHEFPSVPQFEDLSRVILAYPLENGLTCEEFADSCKKKMSVLEVVPDERNGWSCLDAIVFIDCTWHQSYQILQHERIKCLQPVILTDVETTFWRPSKKDMSHLATVEAIYHLLKNLDCLFTLRNYEGQFDDLLYFYSFQYNLVHLNANK